MDDTIELRAVDDEVVVDGCTSTTTIIVMLFEPAGTHWAPHDTDIIEWTNSRYGHQN